MNCNTVSISPYGFYLKGYLVQCVINSIKKCYCIINAPSGVVCIKHSFVMVLFSVLLMIVMCQYQLSINVQRKGILNDVFSLCNSFSSETYPNNEICLLTRNQYGVTEHCSNTEHLRFV